MRVVFLGDVACRTEDGLERLAEVRFTGCDAIFANLEGPLVGVEELTRRGMDSNALVHNVPAVADYLGRLGVRAVSGANNHFYDAGNLRRETERWLGQWKMQLFGAGDDLRAASKPCELAIANERLVLFGAGWGPIGCKPAKVDRFGVNPLKPSHLLSAVRDARRRDENAAIVVLLHANYELEAYPQPAHRLLAFDLLNAGATMVVGGHSHVFQGAERKGRGVVVHGIGNWWTPPRRIAGLNVRYPKQAEREVAVEVELHGREAGAVSVHWYQFDPEALTLGGRGTETLEGERVLAATPYREMGAREYASWFKRWHKRKLLLPVYTDYHGSAANLVRDQWVHMRQRGIGLLVSLGLKGELRGRNLAS